MKMFLVSSVRWPLRRLIVWNHYSCVIVYMESTIIFDQLLNDERADLFIGDRTVLSCSYHICIPALSLYLDESNRNLIFVGKLKTISDFSTDKHKRNFYVLLRIAERNFMNSYFETQKKRKTSRSTECFHLIIITDHNGNIHWMVSYEIPFFKSCIHVSTYSKIKYTFTQ